MTNNDVLRRIRYIFSYDDNKMIDLFTQGGLKAKRAEVCDWLKGEETDGYQNLSDRQLATFLNGLINDKRGKREGPQPEPENRVNNNIIFMKLKIAMNLKAEEILDLLERADFNISKHELSAFFRKPGHKHYRECKDQILRNFLKGVELKYHI
ncbi:uncharacterized protein YehS (DUF1456 family) [Sinobacterium caligoides]|uniref:Uncharacterized protein YehS (DUF1456 family) n=1 Tax=Sinobacterium caligoides TaxID=933926 RepID=A0A3N2DYD3_9GAMM|nr:DUF1456 family protein [Sinobacterium caligoides]ROS04876.1 uncharacterized protein YehS (DUF1456 family) [Sinobacterium caligoides]